MIIVDSQIRTRVTTIIISKNCPLLKQVQNLSMRGLTISILTTTLKNSAVNWKVQLLVDEGAWRFSFIFMATTLGF